MVVPIFCGEAALDVSESIVTASGGVVANTSADGVLMPCAAS
jgi:hypothetical protein